MGSLHDGHLSIIKQSISICKTTLVSIYINPAQFSPDEDFEAYPRSIDNDISKLSALNVDAVFLPTDKIMYPDGFSTYIAEKSIAKYHEGVSRPLFFQGVLTVVLKLFNIVRPSHAFFGEKDLQQLVLVKKMVVDLNISIQIISCTTIREPWGLAMSSRNSYISLKDQRELGIIYMALLDANDAIIGGINDVDIIKKRFSDMVLSISSTRIDYFEVCDINCMPIKFCLRPCMILAAVYFCNVRLIDSITVE